MKNESIKKRSPIKPVKSEPIVPFAIDSAFPFPFEKTHIPIIDRLVKALPMTDGPCESTHPSPDQKVAVIECPHIKQYFLFHSQCLL